MLQKHGARQGPSLCLRCFAGVRGLRAIGVGTLESKVRGYRGSTKSMGGLVGFLRGFQETKGSGASGASGAAQIEGLGSRGTT